MRQRELLKIGPSALQTFPPLHAPHNSARPMAGDTQRSSSYNERSTLPSYGTSTPPSWKGSAAARHLHQPSATSLRQNVWTVLRFRSSIAHSSGLQFASYVLELFVLALILANVLVALTMSTSVIGGDATTGTANDWNTTFLLVSTVIFSIEYLLRLWSCVEDDRYHGAILGRLRWMTRPLSIIDLIALVPFYLEICIQMESLSGSTYKGALSLRSLRLLRILSFFRLERSYNAMRNLRLIFTRKKEELIVVSYMAAVVVLMSSIMIFFLEHDAQPTVFSSFGVCAWWTVETITSLGYGDIVPITNLGRGFASVLALWGIILFTIPGAVLGSGFIEVMLERQREADEETFNLAIRGSAPSFVGPVSDDEADAVHTALPDMSMMPTPTLLPHMSPTAAAAIQCEQLNEKLSVLGAGQQHLAEQLRHQEAQIAALTKLIEAVLSAQKHTDIA